MYFYIVNHKQSLSVHKFYHVLYHSIGVDPCRKTHNSDGNLSGIPGSIGIRCWYSGTVLLASISRVQNVRHRIVCQMIIKRIIKFESSLSASGIPYTPQQVHCNNAEQNTALGSKIQSSAVRQAVSRHRSGATQSAGIRERVVKCRAVWGFSCRCLLVWAPAGFLYITRAVACRRSVHNNLFTPLPCPCPRVCVPVPGHVPASVPDLVPARPSPVPVRSPAAPDRLFTAPSCSLVTTWSNARGGQVSKQIDEHTSKQTSLWAGEPGMRCANERAETKPSRDGSR